MRSRRTPIGIDLGSRYLKAVQLACAPGTRRGDARPRVEAAAVLPRSGTSPEFDAVEARRLCEVLARQGFAGRDAVVAVPGSKLLSAVQDLPPRSSGAPLEQIARAELGRAFRRDPQALQVALWDLPTPSRGGEGTHVMTAGCLAVDADAILDALERYGLNVVALDTQACALARACAPLVPSEGITAILDIGWSAALLAVLYRGVVVYQRPLAEAGIGRLFQNMSERLAVDAEVTQFLLGDKGLTAADEMARRSGDLAASARGLIAAHFDAALAELRVSFGYAAHQYAEAAVERLLLTGGGACIPGLATHLGSALAFERIAVSVAAPADLAECSPAVAERPALAALTPALGLALYLQSQAEAYAA